MHTVFPATALPYVVVEYNDEPTVAEIIELATKDGALIQETVEGDNHTESVVTDYRVSFPGRDVEYFSETRLQLAVDDLRASTR